jgi:hypothetical protein
MDWITTARAPAPVAFAAAQDERAADAHAHHRELVPAEVVEQAELVGR